MNDGGDCKTAPATPGLLITLELETEDKHWQGPPKLTEDSSQLRPRESRATDQAAK